jgi:aminoglycoside phosphotransferase (APT) family kinase protein
VPPAPRDLSTVMAENTDAEKARVAEAVEATSGAPVERVEALGGGTVNRCYRLVTAATQTLVVKVFGSGTWPEEGKLQWIDEQLSRRGIPHPRMLAYARRHALFPCGFAVFENVPGVNAHTLMKQNRLTAESFYERLGETLGRVHAVGVAKFGLINGGEGMYPRFLGRLLRRGEGFDRLRRGRGEEAELRRRVAAKIISDLKALDARGAPALTHGDPSPQNCVLTTGGELVLVDWDNATASLGLRDYALVTYACRRAAGDAARPGEIGAAFFRRYGELDFAPADVARLERAWHLIWTYNGLVRSRDKETASYARARSYLLSLL